VVKLPRQRPVFRHEPGYNMHFPSPSVLMIALAPFVLWTVLFVLAEYGNLMLKPLKPWLGAALLLLFGINILRCCFGSSMALRIDCRLFWSYAGVWPA
jgi:hypothetical protein